MGTSQIRQLEIVDEESNCFGPKSKEAQYGPGSRLAFKNGEGSAHVQIETKSGNVNLCTKDSQGKRSADAATAPVADSI